MEITKGEQVNEAFIISVKGKLDTASAPEFEKQLSSWIDDGDNKFVLDFNELTYISSGGLRSILVIAKKLKGTSGQLCLFGLKPTIKKVFDISGFSALVPIRDSKEDALGAV